MEVLSLPTTKGLKSKEIWGACFPQEFLKYKTLEILLHEIQVKVQELDIGILIMFNSKTIFLSEHFILQAG